MPFGLNGAPGTMQRLMDNLLAGLGCAIGYIDDILIYSPTVDHKRDLRIVLSKIKEAGITLRGSKCRIGVSEVPCLGHVFSGRAILTTRLLDKYKSTLQKLFYSTPKYTELAHFLSLDSPR